MADEETRPLLDKNRLDSQYTNVSCNESIKREVNEHNVSECDVTVSDAPELRAGHAVYFPVMLLLTIAVGIGYFTTHQWVQVYVKYVMGLNDSAGSQSGCNASHDSPEYRNFHEVERRTAQWTMYMSLASMIPSLFTSSIIGSYSDSYGRKIVFVLFAVSTTIRLTICTVVIHYKFSMWFVVGAIALDGLTGSTYTCSSVSMAYLADITSAGTRRTLAITINDGFHLLCVTLSFLTAGVIIKHYQYTIPMLACSGMAALALVITLCFLPETHEDHHRIEPRSPCRTYKRIFEIFTSSEFRQMKVAYILLFLGYFFQELAGVQRTSIEIVYQLGQPFCWSPDRISVFSAARHATQGLAGVVFVVPLRRCLSETYIAAMSALFNTGSYILEALAESDIILYLGELRYNNI